MKVTLAALLLGSHLICVNLAAGGPLLAARLDWLAHRQRDASTLAAARWLAGVSLAALLLGAVLGLALAWVRWSPQYRLLWSGPLRDKLFWATWEFLFSLLLLVGWCWSLPRRCDTQRWPAAARGLMATLAATNLLYHFPFLFGVARRLVDRGLPNGEPLPRAVFRGLMVQQELPALAVHVAVTSLAVAGGMLLLLARMWLRQQQSAQAQAVAALGGRWALAGSLAQFPVGLWLLITLPPTGQSQILGGDTWATLLFVVSLSLAVLLVFQLAHLLAAPPTPRLLLTTAATLVATVLLMTALYDQARAMNHVVPVVTWDIAAEESG